MVELSLELNELKSLLPCEVETVSCPQETHPKTIAKLGICATHMHPQPPYPYH